MGEGGEGSSSQEVYQAEVVHAHVTPGKPSGSDPSRVCKNLLGNPFGESILKETSVKKSFSCWDGSSGSSSQIDETSGGMRGKFLMDDVEMWNSISCRDLLALADANKTNGSGNGANAAETQHGDVQQNFRHVGTGLSLQFTPMTPDPARKGEHKQLAASDLVTSNEDGRRNLDEQSQTNVSTLVETNEDLEKGITEKANLNDTPQPKQ
nr:protein ROS1-like [Tanacetum cinerariifolium]